MVSIKEVAIHAGVSIGTVSKVINNVPGVSENKRKSVLESIDALDYHPNMYARNMRAKSSRTIGIFVPLVSDPYFPEFYEGINKKLEQIGYMPILFSGNTKELSQRPLKLLTQMMKSNLDGLIISTYGWDDDTIHKLEEIAQKIPVVSYKRSFVDSNIYSVGVDDFSGMYQAVEYLIKIGHRRIAYLHAAPQLKTSQDRFNAYQQALQDYQIAYDPAYVAECPFYSIANGYEVVKQILKKTPLPTAIVGGNDSLAIGALKYMEELHIRVPQDIALMGYDEVYLSQIVNPQLSTISIPIDEMTSRAVDLIVDNLVPAKPSEQENNLFPTRLVIRGSTDMTVQQKFI